MSGRTPLRMEPPDPRRRTFLKAAGVAVSAPVVGSVAYASRRSDATQRNASARDSSTAGEPPWSRTYNQRGDDRAFGIVGLEDGSLVVVGDADSDTDGSDAWLFKIADDGDIAWRRTFDGPGGTDSRPYDTAADVVTTQAGGFAICGATRGEDDVRRGTLIRTDEQGREIGFTSYDEASGFTTLLQAADDGFVLLAFDSVIRTGPDGTNRWQTTVPADPQVYLSDVVAAHDGGFVLAGSVASETDEDHDDIYLAHVDAEGTITSSNRLDLTDGDTANGIDRTETGYAVAGITGKEGAEHGNGLLLHVMPDLEAEWHRAYSDVGTAFHAVTATADGGYFLAGDANDYEKAALLKTTADGDREWSRTVSTEHSVVQYSCAQTPVDEFVSAGYSTNPEENIPSSTALVVNLGQDPDSESENVSPTPYPSSESATQTESPEPTQTGTPRPTDRDHGTDTGTKTSTVSTTPDESRTTQESGASDDEDTGDCRI